MYIDFETSFTRGAQPVTSSALAPNVLDLLAEAGGGQVTTLNAAQSFDLKQLSLVALATEVFAGTGTLTIALETSADVGLTSSTVLAQSAAFSIPALVAGTPLLIVRLPRARYLRYLGLRFIVAGGVATTGRVNAFLTADPQRNFAHASNFKAA